VKLGDFGLSKLMQSHDFASTYVGTPFYMSPEICAAEKYTLHSDIWALGCIMYELCTKEPPFNAKTHLQLVQKIRKGVFDPLPSIYSRDLQNVIANCLKVNPLHRPDTASLLTIPYVWIARKGKEMVDFGKVLKTKEELAAQKLHQAEERLSALEADKFTMRQEIEAAVRREWEVKARLEIDRQVQMELERLRKKFEKEVDEKAHTIVSKQLRGTERGALREIPNPPATSNDENINPQSSVNSLSEEDFPSTTDLTELSELSLHSPSTSTSKPLPSKMRTKAPFTRSKTTFDTPDDVHMSEPSPMSISSLALSPRRNAAAQAANDAGSKNIFAEAARQRAKWEPTLAYTSDDDDDEIPDLPSPSRPKVAAADPFKMPARPGLMRQNTTATMQKLTTQPTLFPSTSNTAAAVRAATASALPRTVTEPDMRPGGLRKSPGRRLSKIPSSTTLAADAGSPIRKPIQGLSRAASGIESKQGKDGGEEMAKAVMQRNLNIGQGRTLVELAQARAGGRPLSMDVGKSAQAVKLAPDHMERDLPPVPLWDPERDEMPSPFLVRGTKAIRNLR
jgi:serine/threonine protein kinase